MVERRVAITGLGAVSPLGADAESSWARLIAGEHGFVLDEALGIVGRCREFDPEALFPRRKRKETSRFIQLALTAAKEAVAAAEPPESALREAGVIVGVGVGGLAVAEQATRDLAKSKTGRVSPFFVSMMIPNLAAGQVAMEFGCLGPSFSTTSACTSGAHALGEAFRKVRSGELSLCLAGGAESTISPTAVAGFNSMRALARGSDPDLASRPFDRNRSGFVLSEGAAVLVLEDLEHAQKRGARILGELLGYGTGTDAYHLSSPSQDGRGLSRAIEQALREAKLEPGQLVYVNAHATSTPAGDAVEAATLARVVGPDVPVSSTKGATGHSLGAAGALEAVLTVQALGAKLLPATRGLTEVDPACAGIKHVFTPTEAPAGPALSTSSGFGGTNAALVFAPGPAAEA